MRSPLLSSLDRVVVRALMFCSLWVPSAASQTFTVLHQFAASNDACAPLGPMVFDAHGNLFGTSENGPRQYGTIFKLTPLSGGTWASTVLYSFDIGNGMWPHPPVIFDSSGNYYVALQQGGATMPYGGVVQLSSITGELTETILHAFQGPDGELPYGGLAAGSDGYLYGATQNGGNLNGGVVFRVGTDAGHPFTVLAPFNDGPNAPVILAPDGSIYGSTYAGGLAGDGTVFQLTHESGKATWTQKVLYTFSGLDGNQPNSIVMDAAGNIYGVTVYGGDYGDGVVFKLTEQSDGSWAESALHSFAGPPSDGRYPNGTLTLDAAGNLYGATLWGGADDWGTTYKLAPSGGGQWTETVLHSFTSGDNGDDPSTVVVGRDGNVYGTSLGAQYGCGLAYEIAP
jgi:uncharacterized repeat protein (TIGR03803 family)